MSQYFLNEKLVRDKVDFKIYRDDGLFSFTGRFRGIKEVYTAIAMRNTYFKLWRASLFAKWLQLQIFWKTYS